MGTLKREMEGERGADVKQLSGVKNRRCCLVIIDGWGCNENGDVHKDGIKEACPRNMLALSRAHPSTLLYAHGKHVGLVSNKMMGNSEVGHLTIGAGRAVKQDSVRIRETLLRKAPETLRKKLGIGKRVHILGILSDGNVHGHWKDMLSISSLCSDQ
jgi:2,3-bisphosphoglycerate-independent phosphoglycerate mutase